MEFGVIHTIKDPAGWREVISQSPPFPEDFRNPVYVLTPEGDRGLCVWRAPSIDALQSELDRVFGRVAVNEVFHVEVQKIEAS
jgi:hypothetical protein